MRGLGNRSCGGNLALMLDSTVGINAPAGRGCASEFCMGRSRLGQTHRSPLTTITADTESADRGVRPMQAGRKTVMYTHWRIQGEWSSPGPGSRRHGRGLHQRKADAPLAAEHAPLGVVPAAP